MVGIRSFPFGAFRPIFSGYVSFSEVYIKKHSLFRVQSFLQRLFGQFVEAASITMTRLPVSKFLPQVKRRVGENQGQSLEESGLKSEPPKKFTTKKGDRLGVKFDTQTEGLGKYIHVYSIHVYTYIHIRTVDGRNPAPVDR